MEELKNNEIKNENLFNDLNGPVFFEYDGVKNPEMISLHIAPSVSVSENPIELKTFLNDSLKKLAKFLKEDPKYSNVKKIIGETPLGYEKNQKLIEKFGFKIGDKIEGFEAHHIEISKEDIIKLYS